MTDIDLREVLTDIGNEIRRIAVAAEAAGKLNMEFDHERRAARRRKIGGAYLALVDAIEFAEARIVTGTDDDYETSRERKLGEIDLVNHRREFARLLDMHPDALECATEVRLAREQSE